MSFLRSLPAPQPRVSLAIKDVFFSAEQEEKELGKKNMDHEFLRCLCTVFQNKNLIAFG